MSRYLLLLALALGCSSAPPAAEAPAPAAAAASPAAAAAAPSPSRVVTEHVHSEALGVDKAVVIYLPRGYDARPATRWPVFYYLHGLGGTETDWVEGGRLADAADALGLGAIVVMPDGDDSFYVDSPLAIDYDRCMKDGSGLMDPARQPHDATCVRKRRYETYIASDLVRWTDATYRTIASRDGRAIAGLSMGGFGAMELALRHPDLFAAAASHSGAIALLYRGPRPFVAGKAELATEVTDWGKGAGAIGAWIRGTLGPDIANWKAHDVVELASKLAPGKVALYFDCGTEDMFGLNDNVQYVHEALTARHIEHQFYLGPGQHDFSFWSARVPKSLAFLRDHVVGPQTAAR
ncbi:MAG TPA: alpha/beta hydrolase family protein [Kofleriaceae bacterium]|nr:alpha/beta hydrolase family protein [Kofleriaceae bacterium]